MKAITIFVIVLMLVLGTIVICHGQQNDSQVILAAINAKRENMKLPPLVYRIGEQLTVQERVMEISYKFELSEDCGCDYESIAGDHSLQMLVNKLVNTRKYQWYHFESDARFAAIAVVESRGIYYCVVRTYAQ
jgi:hypothetical protein